MVKSSCGRTSSFYLSRSFVVSSMGYRSGNLAVHGGGASMSQIVHGVFLKRTLLLSAQIPTKRTLPTACLSSLSNAVTLSLHNGGALFLHTRTFMGLHLLKRGLLQDRDSTSWRFSGSMKTGSALSVRGDQGNSERSFSGGSRANNSVVVVESPSKAKTIEKYLGLGYTVLPTYGHIRDLAAQAGSVRPNDDYEMIWKVPEDAYTHINKIKDATTKAELLVLATDPDREGEAIAWHVSEVLKDVGVLEGSKPKVVRVTFNEITKNAVLHAMQNPRDICSTLVTAYLARRALDHLIGFGLSPVLWRKLPGSRSAGRVQSVALKLICDREKEREEFVQQEYWTVEAYAKLGQGQEETELFRIRPTHVDGNKIEKFSFGHADASSLSERLKNNQVKVVSVEMHHKRRNPPSPYITSTLQMDAQAKLGYGAIRTMTLAQSLYEGVKLENDELTGLITYMRTDGLQLSNEAVRDIRSLVAQRYGEKFVPQEVRKFSSKVKNAQEAHEAIRPTDIFRLPSQLVHVLKKDALLLYTLIWNRTVACQMEQAVYVEASANFVSEDASIHLQATSSSLSFPGFLAALKDNHDIITTTENSINDESEHSDIESGKNTNISSLKKNDNVVVRKAEPLQHFTRPPSRFSEGLLVKAMEELGIGRPSTYASMLKTLEVRKYVKIENHRITPEPRGRMVAAFLSEYFSKYIDFHFTARLEEQLDEVSAGKSEWKDVLRGFWPEFQDVVTSSMKVSQQEVVAMLQKTLASHCFKGLDIDGRVCPSCGAGRVSLKLTRFGLGYFFGCDKYPDCTFTAEVGDGHTESSSAESSTSAEIKMVGKYDVLLGIDPETDLEIRVKRGPFGYYIQLGSGKGRSNFKIPKTFDPTALTLQKAKEIMTFPLTLGNHPDDGQPVTIAIGNTGYYVRHGNVSTSLSEGAEPLQFTLESALDILKGKRLSRSGRKTMVSTATGKHKNQRKQKITELSVTSEAQNGLVPEDVVVESADLEANTGKEVRAKAKMRRTNRKEIHKTERQVTDEELVHTDFKFEETQGQTQTHITIKANRRTRKTNSKMSNDEGNVEADAVCVSKDKDPVELGKQKRRNMKSKPGTGTVEKVKEGRERRSKTLTGGHLNDENCSFGEPDMDYEKERQQMNDVLSTDKKKVGRPSKRRVSLASVASE